MTVPNPNMRKKEKNVKSNKGVLRAPKRIYVCLEVSSLEIRTVFAQPQSLPTSKWGWQVGGGWKNIRAKDVLKERFPPLTYSINWFDEMRLLLWGRPVEGPPEIYYNFYWVGISRKIPGSSKGGSIAPGRWRLPSPNVATNRTGRWKTDSKNAWFNDERSYRIERKVSTIKKSEKKKHHSKTNRFRQP